MSLVPVVDTKNTLTQVSIGSTIIPVEVVSSAAAIDKGLSNRRSLEASHGMLFTFDHTAVFKFWMRNMRFPIDIIWIGEGMQIVDISENVPTVPFYARPPFHSPKVPARYVLEVNAHFCKLHTIQVGNAVTIDSIVL